MSLESWACATSTVMEDEERDGQAPDAFRCSITLEVMADPVIAIDGHSYDRESITEWFRLRQPPTSPKTGEVLTSTKLITNHNIRQLIQEWREAKEAEQKRLREEAEQQRKKKVKDFLKTLPTDASDRLKEAIDDIVHNKVEEPYLQSNSISTRATLDLSHNKISDEGAKTLSEALKVNTALQWLGLDYNNISDEGAKALTESLKVNKALQESYLHSNNISDAVKQQIVRELKKNCLETITVGCNKKPSVSDEILAEMEKVIISEAQKGNKIGTVRTYLVAYRKQAGVPESFRFPTGWVTNIHKEHFVEKPNDSPVKL